MSGFAGIIEGPGAVLNTMQLDKMSRLIERHGDRPPRTHHGRDFALSHALLCCMPESNAEKQPLSLDGMTWVVGDVRIDRRAELVEDLNRAGLEASTESPDIYLVMRAYQLWGDRCVDHLLGDFAFAIWNSTDRTLFCARDHFGIKPFYYSLRGATFIFSNDLEAVRSNPAVSDRLNDPAICDYFAFGYNLDEASTSFQDIHRLPPGHSLAITRDAPPRLHNYRQIDVTGRIHYSDPAEYAEHFLEIFSAAIADRLRNDHVTFELSGGLDSTSVAAMAAQLNDGNPGFSGLGITTASSRDLATAGEAAYAGMAAQKCGLEHEIIEAGREEDFYAYCSTPQPYAWPFAATTKKFARAARKHSKILLGGQMGDVLFQGSGNPVLDEFRESSLPAFALKRTRAVFSKRSLRALGIRTLIRKDRPLIKLPPLPPWLKHDIFEKSGSKERWKELFYRRGRYPVGCRAETTHDELNMPFWSHLFESYYHDLLCGIDCRQPFMDLRLIEFVFSIPASVKVEKKLPRQAMAGLLPAAILDRPKTNLEGDIVQDCLMSPGGREKVPPSLASADPWINGKSYRQAFDNYCQGNTENVFTILCPVSFEHWICNKLVVI